MVVALLFVSGAVILWWLGYTLTSFLVVPLATIFFALGFYVRSFYFGGTRRAELGEGIGSRLSAPSRPSTLDAPTYEREASSTESGTPQIQPLPRATEPEPLSAAAHSGDLRGDNTTWREEFNRIFVSLDSADRGSSKQG